MYRARDTRLGRDVAIKILPRAFTTDPDRLARFEREARVLASLNHPNIGAIYGFEEGPAHGPAEAGHYVRGLVLELVEGETLADHLRHGALPMREALDIARRIADALDVAHERGIVHRDLKPGNIKITPGGIVKVLDFGLAKAASGDGSGPDLTHSPTITVAGTRDGVILGTAAYMSPEQARGKSVDKRTDIWAFGCVLYEMLTGRAAFARDTLTDTLAAIVERAPDWGALPIDCPAAVRRLLRRCLEKDRGKRIADISTALFVLDEAEVVAEAPAEARHYGQQGQDVGVAAGFSRRDWRRVALLGVAPLVVGAILTGSGVWFFTRSGAPRITRTNITPSEEFALSIDAVDRDLAITRDGTRVVYAGANGTRLFVRPLDALEPTPLVSLSGGAQGIFTSPDGQWVGYVENNTTLKKIAITGGPSLALLRMDGLSRGVTWSADDTIIFATSQIATGLQSVSAGGGTPAVLTRPDSARGEADHLWPETLPGGRSVLFTITAPTGGLGAAQIAVLNVESGSYRTLVRGGSHAHYVASGHLVYAAGETLRAVAFDLDRLTVRGTPVPVLPRLVTTSAGAADFGVAADGTLVYVDAPGYGRPNQRMLIWVDRHGVETPLAAPPRAYMYPRLSPDGTRVAVGSGDQEMDVWLWDLRRATLTRVTFDGAEDNIPVWTADGRYLVFTSARAGPLNLYAQLADATGSVERLTESSHNQIPGSALPDGTGILFVEGQQQEQPPDVRVVESPRGPPSIRAVPSSSKSDARTMWETPFLERNPIVSPDGRWLAYEANPAGELEIFVRPFPNVRDREWQVSSGGGRQPLWARNGRELFYIAPDGSLFTVPVQTRGGTWNAGSPVRLLPGRPLYALGSGFAPRMYDVSVDGRFLMVTQGRDGNTASPQIVVVQNWHEDLKRLVPPR